jgi:hypothetical protein
MQREFSHQGSFLGRVQPLSVSIIALLRHGLRDRSHCFAHHLRQNQISRTSPEESYDAALHLARVGRHLGQRDSNLEYRAAEGKKPLDEARFNNKSPY